MSEPIDDWDWELVVDYNPITRVVLWCYYDPVKDIKTTELPDDMAEFINTTKARDWIGHLSTSHLPFQQIYTHKPSGTSVWHEPRCLREVRDGYIDNVDDWSIRSKKLEMSQELQDQNFDFDNLLLNHPTIDGSTQQQIKINRLRYEGKVTPNFVCFYRNNVTQQCQVDLPPILDAFQQNVTTSHRDWTPQLSGNVQKFFYVHKSNVCLWDMPLLYKTNRDKHISTANTRDDWRIFISKEYPKTPLYFHKSKVTQFELPTPLRDLDMTIHDPALWVGGVNPITKLPYYYCKLHNLTMWDIPHCIKKLKRQMLFKRIADEQECTKKNILYDDKDHEFWEVQYTALPKGVSTTTAAEDDTNNGKKQEPEPTHIIYYKHRLTHECSMTLPTSVQNFIKTTKKTDWMKVSITGTTLFYYEHSKSIMNKDQRVKEFLADVTRYDPLNGQLNAAAAATTTQNDNDNTSSNDNTEGICCWTSPVEIINQYQKLTAYFGDSPNASIDTDTDLATGTKQDKINPEDDIDTWLIYYDPHATTTSFLETATAVSSDPFNRSKNLDVFITTTSPLSGTKSMDGGASPKHQQREASVTRKATMSMLQYKPESKQSIPEETSHQAENEDDENVEQDTNITNSSPNKTNDNNNNNKNGNNNNSLDLTKMKSVNEEDDDEDDEGGFGGGLIHSGTLAGFGDLSGYLGDILKGNDLIPPMKKLDSLSNSLGAVGEDDESPTPQLNQQNSTGSISSMSSPRGRDRGCVDNTFASHNNGSNNNRPSFEREYSVDPSMRFGGGGGGGNSNRDYSIDPVSRMGVGSTTQRHLTSSHKGQPFYFNTITKKLTTDLPDCFDLFQLTYPSTVNDWESVIGKIAPIPFYRYKANKNIVIWHEPLAISQYRNGAYREYEEMNLLDTVKDWSIRFVVETNTAYYKNTKTLWYQSTTPLALKEYADQQHDIVEWESIMSQTCPGVVIYCHVDLKTNDTKCAILEPPECAKKMCQKIDPSTTKTFANRIQFFDDKDYNVNVTYEDNALNWGINYDPDTNYTYYRNYKTLHCTPNIPKCLYMLGTSKYTKYDDWQQIPVYFDLDGNILKQDEKDKLDKELIILQQQNKKIKKLYIEKRCWGFKIPNTQRFIRMYHQPSVVREFMRQNDQLYDWTVVRSGDNSKVIYKNKKTNELSLLIPPCVHKWLHTEPEASVPDNWVGSIDAALKKSYYKHKQSGVMLLSEDEPPCLQRLRLDAETLPPEQRVAQWVIMASRNDNCCYYQNKITKQCQVGMMPAALIEFTSQTYRAEWSLVPPSGAIPQAYWLHMKSGVRVWERPDFLDSDQFTEDELAKNPQQPKPTSSSTTPTPTNATTKGKPKLILKPKLLKPSSVQTAANSAAAVNTPKNATTPKNQQQQPIAPADAPQNQ